MALNNLETVMNSSLVVDKKWKITIENVKKSFSKETFLYDRSGEEHYNIISVFF